MELLNCRYSALIGSFDSVIPLAVLRIESSDAQRIVLASPGTEIVSIGKM